MSEGLSPDLIVLAMLFARVPDGDGWLLLRERQRRPDIAAVPVLLTTVAGKGAGVAASLGAQGDARKPTGVEPLLAEVSRLPRRQPVAPRAQHLPWR